ncbi:hypothetical protein ACIQUQ_19340 [Streptomyces sp. NPDC101118]|uniref:hypothetical protein n=1 Tax=Streptomyces sp. NPDC101118 TaxID=3366109 RepID=UPI00381F6000
MHRPARTIAAAAVIALGASALAAAPAVSAQPPAAAPAATCTVSDPNQVERVTIEGKGFAQGEAQLSSPGSATTDFNVPDGGSFRIANKADGRYAVTQGGTTTVCTGGPEPTVGPGTTYKAGVTAGWDAVREDCAAKPPASANEAFRNGWNDGASAARELFCS